MKNIITRIRYWYDKNYGKLCVYTLIVVSPDFQKAKLYSVSKYGKEYLDKTSGYIWIDLPWGLYECGVWRITVQRNGHDYYWYANKIQLGD